MENTEIHPSEQQIQNNISILQNYLDKGYTISSVESYYTTYDENTRFVIMEKYPEKDKFTEVGGILIQNIHLNLELTPPPIQYINLDITINEDGTIQ